MSCTACVVERVMCKIRTNAPGPVEGTLWPSYSERDGRWGGYLAPLGHVDENTCET